MLGYDTVNITEWVTETRIHDDGVLECVLSSGDDVKIAGEVVKLRVSNKREVDLSDMVADIDTDGGSAVVNIRSDDRLRQLDNGEVLVTAKVSNVSRCYKYRIIDAVTAQEIESDERFDRQESAFYGAAEWLDSISQNSGSIFIKNRHIGNGSYVVELIQKFYIKVEAETAPVMPSQKI